MANKSESLNVQINSVYEFPKILDLDRDDGKYLSKKTDRSVHNKFKLHSMLVHSGESHGGHYSALINPNGKQWIRLDNGKVSVVPFILMFPEFQNLSLQILDPVGNTVSKSLSASSTRSLTQFQLVTRYLFLLLSHHFTLRWHS